MTVPYSIKMELNHHENIIHVFNIIISKEGQYPNQLSNVHVRNIAKISNFCYITRILIDEYILQGERDNQTMLLKRHSCTDDSTNVYERSRTRLQVKKWRVREKAQRACLLSCPQNLPFTSQHEQNNQIWHNKPLCMIQTIDELEKPFRALKAWQVTCGSPVI